MESWGGYRQIGAIARYCRKRGLGNCESDQATAKQDNAGNDQSEEAVRSEFFTHSTPKENQGAGLQYPRSHTAATDLNPAASARRIFLLLLSGAVSCCCCLSRRCCSRSARAASNLAAHRRSHLLSRSRGILLITQKLRVSGRPPSKASTRASLQRSILNCIPSLGAGSG